MLKCWILKNKSHKKPDYEKFLSKLMIRRRKIYCMFAVQPFIFTLSFPFCESQWKKCIYSFQYGVRRWLGAVCMWVLVRCSAMHSFSKWWLLSICLILPWLISKFKIGDYILTSSINGHIIWNVILVWTEMSRSS